MKAYLKTLYKKSSPKQKLMGKENIFKTCETKFSHRVYKKNSYINKKKINPK